MTAVDAGGGFADSPPGRNPVRLCFPKWAVVLLTVQPVPSAAQLSSGLAADLQHRVEVARTQGTMWAADRPVHARRALVAFYEGRGYAPAWYDGGAGQGRRDQLIRAVRASARHGLAPDDYGLDALSAPPSADGPTRVDREILFTNAFLLLGSHLLHGRVNPESVEAEWLANRRNTDMAVVLAGALEDGDVAAALEALAPRQERYHRLQQRYERFRRTAGGDVAVVPSGPVLREGDTGSRVAALAARLRETGDLKGHTPDSAFGPAVKAAVIAFQERWGLERDGAVGSGTLALLNLTDSAKADQIRVNLERWRWLPDTLGTRHIEVNIADFRLDVVESGRPTLTLRAIVGRDYRQTPMFSAPMRYLVLSPVWHVPPNIAARDKLPEIRKDPAYVTAQRMALVDQSTNAPVDPGSVDWTSISGREFNQRYRLRQEPGPWNALGQVKFMFPNRHNVYIHDTPSRELFDRDVRAFSSGCIRVQNPLDLAEHLLRSQPGWNRAAIEAAAGAGTERTVTLASPVPVHLLYWTAWVDDEGELSLRPDLYGRDAKVLAALNEPPPSDAVAPA